MVITIIIGINLIFKNLKIYSSSFVPAPLPFQMYVSIFSNKKKIKTKAIFLKSSVFFLRI